MTTLLFLDIDGVLNGHEKFLNGYCGTRPDCVENLNAILELVPEAKIVVSSAWRYLVTCGEMTLKGFECLLLTHGVKCHGRVYGVTEEDPPGEVSADSGLEWRKQQIERFVASVGNANYVVVDDLPLPFPSFVKFVRTNGEFGLTTKDAQKVVELFSAGY